MLKVNQLTGFWYSPSDLDFLGGAALILGESAGMGIDFTYHTDINKQVKIRGTGAYYGSAYGKLTYTSPSIKLCRQADGVWRYGNHNARLRSADLANGVSYQNVTYTGNSTTDPAGTSFADTITASAGTGVHSVIGSVFGPGTAKSVGYQFSLYAKKLTHRYVFVGMYYDTNTYSTAVFDLDGGGSVATQTGALGSTITLTSMTSMGNGWFRCVGVTTGFATDNAGPTFHLGLAGAATGNSFNAQGDISWTAAGTEATYFWGMECKRTPVQEAAGLAGYIETGGAVVCDLPFEWDISGNSLGILVEEQRTNLALRSQEADNAAWDKTNVTVTANHTTSPDGTTTADKLTCNTGNGTHFASINGTTSANGTHTVSVFAKYINHSYVMFKNSDNTAVNFAVVFNIQTGTIIGNNTGFGAYGAPVSSSITDAGNGWYRLSITATNTGGATGTQVGIGFAEDGNVANDNSWATAGTEELYIWGAQAEAGAFPTSPIHTVAGSVSRLLDNISLPTASFPYQTEPASWYGKGMIDSGVIAIVNTLICGDAGGPAEPLRAGSATSIQVSNNLDFAQSDNGGSWFTAPRMAASRYALNDYAVVKDGDSTPGVDTSTAAIPSSTNMFFGGRSNQTLMWNGHIHHIAFFKRALSDAELISKTNDGPGASDLLLNENDGMSFDFLYAEVARQCRIKDNTTLANNFHGAPRAKLTYTSPSAKLTRQSDGVWRYGNHNLALQSQDFSSWTNQAVTTTVNTTTAPDGTSTADLVVPTATSNSHNVNRTDLPGVIAAHTATIYAKAAGYNWVEIMLSDTGFSQYFGASFNVSTGATGTTRSSTWTGSSSITAVANGFYKIVIVAIPGTVTPNRITIGVHSADDFGNVFTGNGTSGVYLWGAGVKRYPVQEASGVAGYLATGGAAVYDLPYEWSTALASQGILIEEARTNLMLRSQEFDNASWTKDSTTITANNTTAPDGTSTADRINVTAANAEHRLYQSGSSGVEVRTQSVFAKAGTASFIGVTGTGTSTAGATFDLSNGTVGNIGAGVTSATMTAEANGWYRCNVTNVSGTTEYLVVTIGDTAAHAVPGTIWNAAGTETVYLWDGQVEVGAFPTSPIHTIAATVTRAVDNITLLTSAFPYSATAGSVVAAAIWPRSATFGTGGANLKIITLTDGTANENLRLGKTDGVGSVKLSINDSGNFVEPATGSSIVNSVMFKAAFANTTNDVALVLNGGTPATNATSVTPTCTKMAFGQDFNTTQLFNGYICQITYLKRRATNVELQAKTS